MEMWSAESAAIKNKVNQYVLSIETAWMHRLLFVRALLVFLRVLATVMFVDALQMR